MLACCASRKALLRTKPRAEHTEQRQQRSRRCGPGPHRNGGTFAGANFKLLWLKSQLPVSITVAVTTLRSYYFIYQYAQQEATVLRNNSCCIRRVYPKIQKIRLAAVYFYAIGSPYSLCPAGRGCPAQPRRYGPQQANVV